MAENSDTQPPQSGGNEWLEASDLNVKLIYGLYILSFVIGVTGLVGIVLAYMNRGRAASRLQTHYTYQIRTFWIGLLYSVICFILVFVGIGVLLMFLVAVWVIVRCIKGLQAISRNEPIRDPGTWIV